MHTAIDDLMGHEDDFGSESSKDGRCRTWMVLAYPDCDEHKNLRDRLNDLDWDYAGIVHDSDDGVKLHEHYVILFKDGRKAKDIANDLVIDVRWLRPRDSKKRALRYLCHRDQPHKHQYPTELIFGTLADKGISANSKGNEMSESQSVAEIIALLDSIEGEVTFSRFMYMVCQRGCYASFRRMGILGARLIEEHNNLYNLATCESHIAKLRDDFVLSINNQDDFVSRCERLERMGFPPQKMGE